MPEDTTIEPVSDDQELAKVLAGVSQNADQAQEADVEAAMPEPLVQPVVQPEPVPTPMPEPAAEPVRESFSAPESETSADSYSTPSDENLDGIKKEALLELRPLVDKLNVSPEEKFDTYLLLLRSTDDKDLISPAYDAARTIADEARRAQALLDIIKEIDFLSQAQKQ